MATLEQLNTVRQRLGQEPLTEMPSDKATETVVTDTTKTTTTNSTESGATTEVKAESTTTEEKPTIKKEEDKKVEPTKTKLSREELLAALKEEGLEVNSLDDFKKKETPEEAAQRRESDKLAYALSKQLITQKEYQSFSADSANLTDLVYRQYLQQQKKEDSELTDAEILAEFREKYNLDSEPDSRKFKRGQQELDVIGNQILKESYKGVYKIDEEFTKYETVENSRKADEKKLLEETPKYKAHIEEVLSKDFTKVSQKIAGETFEIEVPAAILATIKDEFLNLETASSNIRSGYDQETIKEIVRTRVMMASFDAIVEDAAKQYMEKHVKGTKGVPTETTITRTEEKPLTEAQKKARERTFPGYSAIAN